MSYNPAIAKLDIPSRIRKLPIDERGYPVPRFVMWIDGKPDFRVADRAYWSTAYRQRLCWLCGEKLGRHLAFPIGPMCAVNRVTSEPPCHLECARFSVQACPFLTQPKRPRNPHDLPEDGEAPAGVMLERNPGVTLIYVTDSYRPFNTAAGAPGSLFKLSAPINWSWWARGRIATRDEIIAAIDSGLPLLRSFAEQDGKEAIAEFNRHVGLAMAMIPAA